MSPHYFALFLFFIYVFLLYILDNICSFFSDENENKEGDE